MICDLRPCPFCGGAAELRDGLQKIPTFYVICTNLACEIRTLEYLTPAGAAKRWNRRAKDDL